MTFRGRIIHIKDGVMVTLAESAYVDPTVAKPRQVQLARVRQRAEYISVRPRVTVAPIPPKRYGPVKFIDMDPDQCAWILRSGYRCGQKVRKLGASLCQHHDDVAHGRKSKFMEAAE